MVIGEREKLFMRRHEEIQKVIYSFYEKNIGNIKGALYSGNDNGDKSQEL